MKKYTLIFILLLTALTVNAQRPNIFKETTANTEDVATKYFTAYMELDWSKLEPLMHSDITFEDRTIALVYGWKKQMGQESVLKHFKKEYGQLISMKPNDLHAFFSGNVGVFKLVLEYGFKNQKQEIVTVKMPLVTIITVKDGKVVEHQDFGDYRQ